MSFKSIASTVSVQCQEIKQSLGMFPYFDKWDEVVVAECCRVSSILDCLPDEIILGAEKGNADMAYFILDGTCYIIHYLQIRDKISFDPKPNQKLYRSQNSLSEKMNYTSNLFNSTCDFPVISESIGDATTGIAIEKNSKEDLQKKKEEEEAEVGCDTDRHLKVLDDCKKKKLRLFGATENRETSKKEEGVRRVFVRTGLLMKKGCFGLEKPTKDSFVVSATRVKCLRIPRGFLFRHSPCNIWNRICLFERLYFPTEEKILKCLESERKWNKFKKGETKRIVSSRKICQGGRTSEVPISIRLASPMETNSPGFR